MESSFYVKAALVPAPLQLIQGSLTPNQRMCGSLHALVWLNEVGAHAILLLALALFHQDYPHRKNWFLLPRSNPAQYSQITHFLHVIADKFSFFPCVLYRFLADGSTVLHRKLKLQIPDAPNSIPVNKATFQLQHFLKHFFLKLQGYTPHLDVLKAPVSHVQLVFRHAFVPKIMLN